MSITPDPTNTSTWHPRVRESFRTSNREPPRLARPTSWDRVLQNHTSSAGTASVLKAWGLWRFLMGELDGRWQSSIVRRDGG